MSNRINHTNQSVLVSKLNRNPTCGKILRYQTAAASSWLCRDVSTRQLGIFLTWPGIRCVLQPYSSKSLKYPLSPSSFISFIFQFVHRCYYYCCVIITELFGWIFVTVTIIYQLLLLCNNN